MTICVFDNPFSVTREVYQDGKLIAAISANLIPSTLFWRILFLRIGGYGPFSPGRVQGYLKDLPINLKDLPINMRDS